MKIKVGEYIRTKDGIIRKYHHSDIHYGDVLIRTDKKDIIYDFEIVKHSPNIIDLIEEGDYVNGYKVSFISEDYAKFVQCDYPVETGTANHYKFYKESIKDVVTKEQFEQMKYIIYKI